jgi:DNA-binding NtrC family response regulator
MAIEQRYRVLAVDDDDHGLATIAAVLSADVDVVTAPSAERALMLIEREPFHVVCSDFKMGGMNGVELLQRVSALPYAVGCLLLTGTDEYFRNDEGSPYFVLVKPFNPERLIALVLQLARNADMKRGKSAPPPSSGVAAAPGSGRAPLSSPRRGVR